MKAQIHSKFKVFTGTLTDEKIPAILLKEFKEFTKSVTPKSIGISFMEGGRQVIMSLGYTDEPTPGYTTNIEICYLGRFNQSSIHELEDKLETVTEDYNVICHELFVTNIEEWYVVLLTATETNIKKNHPDA